MLIKQFQMQGGSKGADAAFAEEYRNYQRIQNVYMGAIREIRARLETLDTEFQYRHKHNPIHHIQSRVKTLPSIMKKLSDMGQPMTITSAKKHLHDIAGVRVIYSFPSDIYQLADAFLKQDDITLLQRKDYIAAPKPNGYRSLHLIVETPIFLHDQKRMMRVEVQFRTISMDWWASLEHKIRYKKDLPELDHVNRELFECAQMSAQLDARMEKLQRLAETAAAEQHTDSRWGERRSGPLMR